MIFLVYLLLLTLLLALGTLVALSLDTRRLRVGLGTVVFLAASVDLTWMIAPMIGWSAGLSAGVVGGLALLVGLRAWKQGRRRLTSWRGPSRRDLAFLGLVALAFGVVTLLLPVPLDTDAQGFGYLALMLREGGDPTTLAPWHPEIDYLYSPAYPGLIAFLSTLRPVGIHTLQMVFSAATGVIFVWAAYDLGSELGGRRLGRAMMLAALGGTGLVTAFMDSHYTALLALVFALGFLTFALRTLESHRWEEAIGAALCLAGVPLSQPDTTIALVIGYVPWLLAVWLARPRPTRRGWLSIAVIVPALALILVLPWLIRLRDLLGANIESPFEVAAAHWRTLVFMHGGVIVLLALVGAVVPERRRTPAQVLMVVWLIAIVEFSTLGLLERTVPALMAPLLKYDYPFSLAWHGPIIPYTVLGGSGLLWLADRFPIDRFVGRVALPLMGIAGVGLVSTVIFFDPLLRLSKEAGVGFYGAFSSEADVAAMRWLREHAPPDARVLNHPGPHEGDWVPIISERDTVFFRPQPFFRGTGPSAAEQDAFRAFWQNPTDPAHRTLFEAAGVRYVIVPQVFGNPAALDTLLRWRPPLPEAASYHARAVGEAPYLTLVYERDGAQIYEVRGDK